MRSPNRKRLQRILIPRLRLPIPKGHRLQESRRLIRLPISTSARKPSVRLSIMHLSLLIMKITDHELGQLADW